MNISNDEALNHPHSSVALDSSRWRRRALDMLLRNTVKRRLSSLKPTVEAFSATTRRIERLALKMASPHGNLAITQHDVAGVRVEQLHSNSALEITENPFQILYIHGGAFVMCSPLTHRSITKRLAWDTGARVLVPDYRLAPEYPYPAQLEDCLAVYRQMLKTTTADNIAVAGDSAGANLTLTLLHAAKAENLPLPGCAVCLSPWTDLSGGSNSIRENINADALLVGERMTELAQLYLQDAHRKDPLASPLFGDFTDFPPLLFHVGDTEILLDDTLRCVVKARRAGVEVHLRVWEKLPHVFHVFSKHLPAARQALMEVGDFIKTKLNTVT